MNQLTRQLLTQTTSKKTFSTSANGLGAGVLNWNTKGIELSVEQKQQYAKLGYLHIPGCVPHELLLKLRNHFQALCDQKTKIPKTMLVMKDVSIAKKKTDHDESTITKIQDFADDPVFFGYCQHRKIVDIVSDLIGYPNANLLAMHTMLINKPPDSGNLTSRHPLHQDLIYFPFRPADFICCAWTALEKINRSNGCLSVVPGSHLDDLKPHGYPEWEGGVNKAYHGIVDYDGYDERMHVEMEPGDTIFFHPLLVHGSGANRTQGFRKAISCHFANDDLCYYIDVKGTVQEELENEIVGIVRKNHKRYDIDPTAPLTFADTWRARGRAVTGQRHNL